MNKPREDIKDREHDQAHPQSVGVWCQQQDTGEGGWRSNSLPSSLNCRQVLSFLSSFSLPPLRNETTQRKAGQGQQKLQTQVNLWKKSKHAPCPSVHVCLKLNPSFYQLDWPSWWVKKVVQYYWLLYSYNRASGRHEKGWSTDTWCNMDGPRKEAAQWKEPRWFLAITCSVRAKSQGQIADEQLTGWGWGEGVTAHGDVPLWGEIPKLEINWIRNQLFLN